MIIKPAHHVPTFTVEYLCRHRPVWREVTVETGAPMLYRSKEEAADHAEEITRTHHRPARVLDQDGRTVYSTSRTNAA